MNLVMPPPCGDVPTPGLTPGAVPAVPATPGRPPELLRPAGASGITLRRRSPVQSLALNAAVRADLDHLRPWLEWAAVAPTPARTAELTEAGVAAWEAGTDFIYLVGLDAEPGRVIGSFGLHRRIGPGALEIGYWIATDHLGRGIATTAARALTEAAFALPGVHRVEIHCDPANTASAAVARRLGFRLHLEVDAPVRAPGETGRKQVWVLERHPMP
ncbi:GNAT family N-acetyltransferase [Kitasatospora purpeofusca]|uniref:GNAT family N-acetyltransferase n=1 Tax=Kitasatospora purpeofusca TaxID=67352 RepID=UPI002A5B0666|nr:GNAT family N-acetyltransferase [Kitasatospora purpeofusca]MDY0813609.1 GNAT family N-acetyltransferase [Kitasatospora purpeofusca]